MSMFVARYFRSNAAADTAKSLYLNVKSEHDGARRSAIGAIFLLAAVAAAARVVADETDAGTRSADQVLAAGPEEPDHIDEPNQGELAGEQWSEQDVQELRIHTAVEAEHHSIPGQENRDQRRGDGAAAAALRAATVELDPDASRRADGRGHSRDGRRQAEKQST